MIFEFFDFFRRLSRRPKRSSDVPVDAPSNLPTSQSTPQEIFRRPSRRLKNFSDISVDAETAGREDCPLDPLERSSVDPVGAANGSSDVSVDASKNLPTSQSAPQAIFRSLSPRPKESSDVPVGARKNRTAADILTIYKNIKKVIMKKSPFACFSWGPSETRIHHWFRLSLKKTPHVA